MAEATHVFKNVSATLNDTTGTWNKYCYPDTVAYIQVVNSIIPYVVNSTLNVLLAIVATVANALVFCAVRRSTSIRFPSKLLLLNLILTDLGVGLVVQPQFVIFLIAKLNGDHKVTCFSLDSYGLAGDILTSVSLLTMTAICIDRYIAFFFYLRYHEIVTNRRIVALLVIIWSFGVIFAVSSYVNETLFYGIVFSGFAVCFLVISVAYAKIYRGLHNQHGSQVHSQDPAQMQVEKETGKTLNVAKYKRSVSNMLWIYGLFIFCYSPYICILPVLLFYPNSVVVVCIAEFADTFVFLNSCLNPFVYFYRLRGIRENVLQKLPKICSPNSE